MVNRYELVAIDQRSKAKVINAKTNTKLTLQEIDLFTTLFENTEELKAYLYRKGYLNDIVPIKFAIIYKSNKQTKYIECCYKSDQELIALAKSSKETNRINENSTALNIQITKLLRLARTSYREYAASKGYINKYLFDKLEEYNDAVQNGSNFSVQKIERSIIREVSHEYLQARKLYMSFKSYNENRNKIRININDGEPTRRHIENCSNDPYMEYLIEKANNGDERAYEELMAMDIEKTLRLNIR